MRHPHRVIVCGVAGWLSLASGTVAAPQDMAEHAGHTGKLGTVHFPTSCAADVQPSFERSLALLHSFEFREATEGFQAPCSARDLEVRGSRTGASRWLRGVTPFGRRDQAARSRFDKDKQAPRAWPIDWQPDRRASAATWRPPRSCSITPTRSIKPRG